MTLVIALKRFLSGTECKKDGKAELLVFADSKETIGEPGEPALITRKVQKVYPILSWKKKSEFGGERLPAPLALWAGAGASLPLKRGREICENVLNKMFVEKWHKRYFEFAQFREAVEAVGKELNKDRLVNRSAPEMTLGSVDVDGRVSLYTFDQDWTPDPVHSQPGYAVLGKGYIMGAHVLFNLLGYELANSWRFDAAILASFIINRVHEVDPSVGWFEGNGYRMKCKEGGVLLEQTASSEEYLNQKRSRTEIVRSAWKLCDNQGEKRILKELTKLARARKKELM